MRFSNVVAASLVAPLAAAHGGMEGAPKLFGVPKQLRARNPFAAYQAPRDAQPYKSLHVRQSTDGRCGPQGNNQVCASNECCSPAGYCGTTQGHCQAPDCLINFGPACDANKTPNGASTRNDARPQLGSISYGGAGIYSCEKAGNVAITFDDGPYIYTADVLDLFKAKGAKATFFITGNNIGKGAIDEKWQDVIKRMDAEGHQVASHTWSHQDLSQITQQQVYDQMVKNEMAIRNILGKYPTYMRPPYSSCESTCQNVMADLGYVISYFDLDTDDYNQLTPEKIQVAKNNFKRGIDNRNVAPADGDQLAIAHDIHELTAHNLTAYMLDYVYSNGLTAVTMGECMNDPKANWYRASTPASPSSSTASSSAPASSPTAPTSTDATCGGAKGQSCVGFVMNNGLLGECCSTSGYCGSTSDYCGTGCQPGYGKCGAQPSASPSASTTGLVPTPTGKSVDGSCGASKGLTCSGFILPDGTLGECCSTYGYCGNGAGYCGDGCQAGFGKCGTSLSSSSSAAPSSAALSSTRASSSVMSSSSRVSSASSSSRVSSASSSSRVSSASSSSRASSASSSARVVSTTSSARIASTSSSSRASSNPSSSRVSSTSVRSSSSTVGSSTRISSTSFSTSVRASSTSSIRNPATPSPSPCPTVSKDGRCGKNNGDQTCAGYKLALLPIECCNKDTGRCSADPLSCTTRCNRGYGNCWY